MSQIGRKGKIRSYFIPYKRILKKTYISKTSGKGGGGVVPSPSCYAPAICVHQTNVFQKISCTPAHASAYIFKCICIFYFKTTKLSDPLNKSNGFYTLHNDVLRCMNLPPSIF